MVCFFIHRFLTTSGENFWSYLTREPMHLRKRNICVAAWYDKRSFTDAWNNFSAVNRGGACNSFRKHQNGRLNSTVLPLL
jgi:hypothetical protein